MKKIFTIIALFIVAGNVIPGYAKEQNQPEAKTKSLWEMYKETKATKNSHSLYTHSYIKDCGYHQQYHFLDIEKKGQENCCQNFVSPYAEYYIIKSLYNMHNDHAQNHLQHDITARFLISQPFKQGHINNVCLRSVKNSFYSLINRIKWKMYEYRYGKRPSYIPYCNFSTPYTRIRTYVNKMPNTEIQKLITTKDIEKFSTITESFSEKVDECNWRATPPEGLALRCDFVDQEDMEQYLALKKIEKLLKQEKKHLDALKENDANHSSIQKNINFLEKEWQEKSTHFMKNLKEDAVTITAYSFIPGVVENFHNEVDAVISDIKKRYAEKNIAQIP